MALKKRRISASRLRAVKSAGRLTAILLLAIVLCPVSGGESLLLLAVPAVADNPNRAREKAEKIAKAACSIPSEIDQTDTLQAESLQRLRSLGIEDVWDPARYFARENGYAKILAERIFHVLDKYDMGYLKSDQDTPWDISWFIGRELQKVIFLRLPGAADFRSRSRSMQPKYLDGMLEGILGRIITDDFIESQLDIISAELQKRHDARVLARDQKNALFSQGVSVYGACEEKQESAIAHKRKFC